MMRSTVKIGTVDVTIEAWNRYDEQPKCKHYVFQNHTFREAYRRAECKADEIELSGEYKHAAVVKVEYR